ncbi:hypothetical protein LCGC14_1683280 [marine sediment metagenome]|uniref:Uncharacterized protein n=1 Tax=marine sediment metagenome TaxID=412755 RepID=A0A0F9K3J0_9ZZZZ|nr:hypothetical protein [Candidatus Scalindua sp.]
MNKAFIEFVEAESPWYWDPVREVFYLAIGLTTIKLDDVNLDGLKLEFARKRGYHLEVKHVEYESKDFKDAWNYLISGKNWADERKYKSYRKAFNEMWKAFLELLEEPK